MTLLVDSGPFRPGPGGLPPFLAGREPEQALLELRRFGFGPGGDPDAFAPAAVAAARARTGSDRLRLTPGPGW